MLSIPFVSNVVPQQVRRTARLTAFLVLILVSAGHSSRAQMHDRLPDSIPASQEDIQAIKDTLIAVSENSDSVYAATKKMDTAASKNTDTSVADHFRAVPDSTIHRLQREKVFAYANDPALWKEEPENKNDNSLLVWLTKLLFSKGFRYFIYIVLGGVLLYTLYRIIAENNLRMFYRQPQKIRSAPEETTGPEEGDLEEKLRQAIQDKDHRAAVRYLYLRTLRKLEADGAIRYQMRATGQDYISQLSGHPQLTLFRFLHSNYERVWYGEVPVDANQFVRLQEYFNQFNQSTGASV